MYDMIKFVILDKQTNKYYSSSSGIFVDDLSNATFYNSVDSAQKNSPKFEESSVWIRDVALDVLDMNYPPNTKN